MDLCIDNDASAPIVPAQAFRAGRDKLAKITLY
jgi:hypothetical protein